MDSRVFWSVLCALLVFSGLCVAGYACIVAAERRAVADAQAQILQQAQFVRLQVQHALKEQQQQRVLDAVRRTLATDQRCVGGVVIQVDGSAYTQLGSIQNPVHCDAYGADRPLR
jgi:endonuclease/exonuclease/phosphatase (EEP) superfamily protein YafD